MYSAHLTILSKKSLSPSNSLQICDISNIQTFHFVGISPKSHCTVSEQNSSIEENSSLSAFHVNWVRVGWIKFHKGRGNKHIIYTTRAQKSIIVFYLINAKKKLLIIFSLFQQIKFPGIIGPLQEKVICKIKCIDGQWVGPLCAINEGIT